MSILGQCLDDYLAVRRSLGFKLQSQSQMLAAFVGFMEQEGAVTVTTDLAVRWATSTKDSINWRADRLDAVRQFARHLQAIDPRTEVPPAGLLPRCSRRRAQPFIYTDADVAGLMAAAQALRFPISRCTYAALIGLLSVTGMRVGEAIRLDRDDVGWQSAVLTIRGTKFGKSREVALHATTLAALAAYSRRRDALMPRPGTTSVFISGAGTRLIQRDVNRTFRRLVSSAHLPCARGAEPRLHDFRHTFAVRTILGWYRDGGDVEARLPLLSTYLGHVHPISTYWYLSATPELLALASGRLQGSRGGNP